MESRVQRYRYQHAVGIFSLHSDILGCQVNHDDMVIFVVSFGLAAQAVSHRAPAFPMSEASAPHVSSQDGSELSGAGRPTMAGALLQQNMSALMMDVKGQRVATRQPSQARKGEEPDEALADDDDVTQDEAVDTEEEEPIDEEDQMMDMDIGERGAAPEEGLAEVQEAEGFDPAADYPNAAAEAGVRQSTCSTPSDGDFCLPSSIQQHDVCRRPPHSCCMVHKAVSCLDDFSQWLHPSSGSAGMGQRSTEDWVVSRSPTDKTPAGVSHTPLLSAQLKRRRQA